MTEKIQAEMNVCVDQINQLQAKVEVLKQEKALKEAKELIRKQEIVPNLKVMSDWLDECGEIIEETEHERNITEQYDKLSRIPNKKDKTEEEKELIKNQKIIEQEYLRLKSENGQNLRNKSLAKFAKFYQPWNGNNSVNAPSYFMKQYIESTYNMFLIQQQKIDELTARLDELE